MTKIGLDDLAKQLRKLDFCMLATQGRGKAITSRPMSNNGDVDYDGDSWFFSYDNTGKVADIRENDTVALTFTAPPHLLGKPGIFIAVQGTASLISEKSEFQEHWNGALERWFPQGTETPGLLLIKVSANTIQYWDGEENGLFNLG